MTNIDTLRIFCENDNERVRKYIKLYLEGTPKNLEKLKKALEVKDYKSVKSVAHILKTHLKYMGMKETADLAENIEKNCEEMQDEKNLETMVDSMEKMCIISYAELNEYV